METIYEDAHIRVQKSSSGELFIERKGTTIHLRTGDTLRGFMLTASKDTMFVPDQVGGLPALRFEGESLE